MTPTNTLTPLGDPGDGIDENLVRQKHDRLSFLFTLMGCLMNLKCGGRQSLGRGKTRHREMYRCRMMTQIKTEKTIMADYTVISVHQWLPTSPEDELTGGKRAFTQHKGCLAHMQSMLGTNTHGRVSSSCQGQIKNSHEQVCVFECLGMTVY